MDYKHGVHLATSVDLRRECVDLAGEILRAVLMAAVPIGAFTFALVWWALPWASVRRPWSRTSSPEFSS